MRIIFLPIVLAFLCPIVMVAQSPVISPLNPVVNQGESTTLSCTSNCGTGGTWSCSGCAGSINSTTGVYTAPATVNAKQSVYGMQLLPNNHIFNTRIDSLPVASNSATLIAGAGTVPMNYLPSFPLNLANSSTPTESQVFAYTSSNNGIFQIPAYPYAKIESGWLSARKYNPFNVDHHLLVVDTSTKTVQEMYQYYPAGMNGAGQNNCPTCTSQSGQRYLANGYPLPVHGTTDAAGLDLIPLTLRLQEFEQACASGGSIDHALRMTLQNGYIQFNTFVWPATTTTSAGGGVVPYGTRFRLKSSFNISGYSPCAQILLTQLKNYGLILADGGYGWQVNIEATRWPKAMLNYLQEVNNSNIATSNWEVVDESSLMISPSSGEANTARETVNYTASTGTASTDVVTVGAAVGLPNDIMYIQAGTAAQQLTALVGGTSNTGVIWTMSPNVGTLTSGGLYTPPASTTLQSTTITATSVANANVASQMTLWVMPQGTIRLVPGQPSDYTDNAGNVWLSGPGGGGDASCNPGTQSCFGYNNGGTWPTTSNISLYEVPIYATGDLRYDISVPSGTYQINAKFANNGGSTDQGNFVIEPQGVAQASPTDVFALVGNNKPYDFTGIANVTNGLLSFVLRAVNTTGNNVAPFISALQITKTQTQTNTAPPSPPINLTATVK
jgi:hypothetical protein